MPDVMNASGSVIRQIAIPTPLDREYPAAGHAMFRAVHREFANARAGTASTKKRDDVSGGGRKPWKQKGTGRARQGSTRSPQWRHGGVVFGPQPRSFSESLNKKERRLALAAALSERLRSGAVTVLDTEGFAIVKTGEFAKLLFGSAKAAKTGPATLVVCAKADACGDAIVRAGANLARVGVTHDGALDVKDVLRYERIVFTVAAYDAVGAKFSPEGSGS